MLIPRTRYLKQIQAFLGNPVIKIITGMRRVGKTVFLQQIIQDLEKNPKNQIIYIDKENLDFEFIKSYKELNSYVLEKTSKQKSKQKFFLLIDEIQEIQDWEKAIRSLAKQKIEIIITGSNSLMLSSELATFISGRYIEFKILPLSFPEFLELRSKTSSSEEEFNNYLRYGSLPGIHNSILEPNITYQFLNAILNTVILKDVVAKNSIQNYSNFDKLLRFIFDNFASVFSAKSISDYLKSQQIKISVDTVQNYLAFLQEAFLIYKVQRYDLKGKRQLEIYEKYYLSDLGLRHALIGYRPEDISDYLENLVFIELLRRNFSVQIGKFDDYEVDFVAKRADTVLYIQVSKSISEKNTLERELRSLQKIKDHHPKIILSLDKLALGKTEDGIEIINLVNWLLEPQSY